MLELQTLGTVSPILVGLLFLAILINHNAVKIMFEYRSIQKDENGRCFFKCFNWLVSGAFLWSLLRLADCVVVTANTSFVLKPDYAVYLVVSILTLLCLCCSFGISAVESSNINTQQDNSSKHALVVLASLFTMNAYTIYSDMTQYQSIHHPQSSRGCYAIAGLVLFGFLSNLLSLVIVAKWTLVASVYLGIQYLQDNHLKMFLSNETLRAALYSIGGIFVYLVFFAPNTLINLFVSTSYSWAERKSNMTSDGQKRLRKKRLRNYPPAFPNGWYQLADSKEVPRGGIKNVEALGQTFVVFRSDTGVAAVLDAYCPHMGANLGEGGRVEGEGIICPFHEWRFNTDGQCDHIPYQDKVPSSATTKKWPTVEYHNMICIYFDAEGREPPYQLDEVEKVTSGEMRYCGEYDTELEMHVIELCENSADFQHFQFLHGNMKIPFTNVTIPGLTINHEPDFEIEDHRVHFFDKASLNVFGHKVERSGATAKIQIMGPGGVNYFYFTTELGEICLFYNQTPVDPLKQKIRFRYYADKSVPKLLAWYVAGSWASQLKEDQQVWENKIYRSKALLVKSDGPLVKVRRWFNQFYSENSKNIVSGKLDW